MKRNKGPSVLTRREALIAGAGVGAGFAWRKRADAKERAAQPGEKMCVLTPEAMEGPFYFDPKLSVVRVFGTASGFI